jgi:hypothetical protein
MATLLGGNEEAFGFVVRVDPVARLVRQVGFETICQGLIDKGVTVCEEENVLRLIGAEKDVNTRPWLPASCPCRWP